MLALRKCLPIFAVRFDGTCFEGHLAQLVQSARLTRERSLVRVQYCPQPLEAPHTSAGFFVGPFVKRAWTRGATTNQADLVRRASAGL